jgi:VanZ family protein
VVVWAALIGVLSSDAFSGDRTRLLLLPLLRLLLPGAAPETLALVHDLVRKLAHPVEYAVLAWLTARACAQPGRGALETAARSLALCVAWAALDELHQTTTAGRTGAVSDVAIDSIGAAIGLGFREVVLRRLDRARRPAAPTSAPARDG